VGMVSPSHCGVWGCAPSQGKFGEFSTKDAGFYALLLRKKLLVARNRNRGGA